MAKIEENVFTGDDAEMINNYLMDALKEEVEEGTRPDWDELYMAAQKFVSVYDNLERMIHNKNLAMRKKLLQMDVMSSNFIAQKQAGEDTYLRRAQFIAAFEFDRVLTKFRGQAKRVALIVHYDEKGQQIHQLKIPLEVLALYSRGKKGSFDISQEVFAKLREEYGDLNKENLQTEHQRAAEAAFIGTSNRLNRYFDKVNEKAKKTDSNARTKRGGVALLMWNLSKPDPRGWVIARVNGFGDVKEAYIAAFYTPHGSREDKLSAYEDEKYIGPEDGYYNDNLIAAFFYYINKVTNMAAIREEDVVTKDSQYAVKSNSAHLPSIVQYLKVANEIILNSEVTSKKDFNLEKEIEDLYPQNNERNVIIMEGGKIVRENVNENLLNWIKEQTFLKVDLS